MNTQLQGLNGAQPTTYHAAYPGTAVEYYEYPELASEAALGATELASAVSMNRQYSQSLGWRPYFDQIARFLGFTTQSPGEQDFARAIARWQQSQRLLTADGVLGPTTWSQMRLAMKIRPVDKERPKVQVLCPPPPEFSAAERTALAITTRFETGIPYGCPVSKTDGISLGMLQWNLRGTLQPLLIEFDKGTGRLEEFFGAETDRLRRLIKLPKSQAVQEAKDQNLADCWRASFLRLCADRSFCRLLQASIRVYMRRARTGTTRLRLQTVRGLAMMFDICVGDWLNDSKLNAFATRIARQEAVLGRPLSEQEKLRVIAEVAAVYAGKKVEASRRVRRLLIANGSGWYRSAQWNLDRDFPSLNDRL